MATGLRREITDGEIATYREAGVVRLPGILPADWVSALGDAIDEVIYGRWDDNPVHYDITANADLLREQGAGDLLLSDARAESIRQPGQFRESCHELL